MTWTQAKLDKLRKKAFRFAIQMGALQNAATEFSSWYVVKICEGKPDGFIKERFSDYMREQHGHKGRVFNEVRKNIEHASSEVLETFYEDLDRDQVFKNPHGFEELVEHMTLSARERAILYLRFFYGLELLEIGKVLGMSESRVSQIGTSCISRYRRTARMLGA